MTIFDGHLIKSITESNLCPEQFTTLLDESFYPHHTEAILLRTDTATHQHHDLESFFLNDDETQKLASFPLEKRKTQWLFGRVCAKTALLLYEGDENTLSLKDITIRNGVHGRPYAEPSPRLPATTIPDVSISHSHHYALAMAGDGLCGVDIQEPRDSLFRVKERFLRGNEWQRLLPQLTGLSQRDGLNLLWTTKEAIRKALSTSRIPGFLEIYVNNITCTDGQQFILNCRYENHHITVIGCFFNDYSLAATLVKE